MRSFRLLTALIITGLLLFNAPQQAVPHALARVGPTRPAAMGPAASGAAPVARPRGIPPSSFVPAALRAAPRLSPAFSPTLTPPANDGTASLDRNTPSQATSFFFEPTDGGFAYHALWANDNDPDTFWKSHSNQSLPQTWCTDFGAEYQITGLETLWGNGTYDYTILAGPDLNNLTLLTTQTGGSNHTSDALDAFAKVACVEVTDNGLSGVSTVEAKEFNFIGYLNLPEDQGSPAQCEQPEGPPLGGPFNPRTGFLWTSATDLQLPSSGLALDWTRTYVSRAITETIGPLGVGWQHPYNTHLITETMPGGEPGLIIVVAPDGNRWRFQATDYSVAFGNYYRPFPGVSHDFIQHFEPINGSFINFTVTYRLTTRSQDMWTYDLDGRLIKMQDAQGHHLSLTYSPTDTTRLIRVADATNPSRYLALDYNADGRISRVGDGSRFVTYTYTTTGDLIRATDVMSRPTDYEYQDHLLTKITNALGQTVEQTTYDQYTPDGRVVEQTLLDGRHYEVDYQTDATVVTITGPDGREEVQEFHYDQSGLLADSSVNDQIRSYSDFEEHFSPGSYSDANGNTTTTVFNQSCQPQAVTDALGQTTLIDYDSHSHPISMTDTLGRQSLMLYDSHNNLISQTLGITTAFPLGFTNLYTYTTDHHLLAYSGPDGVVTRQTYDAQGQVISRTVGFGTPLAQTSTFGYDQYGRVVTSTVGFGTPLVRVDVTHYNADNTVAETIQNYQDGIFTSSVPDQDIVTTFGYDGLGRQIWTRDVLGRYDVTHYDARGQVDWQANNFVQSGWSGGALPAGPPAYSLATPDQNVATFYGIDGLGRTTFVTETGILTGTFDTTTLQFSDVTQRVTRTEFDALSRPITVTLNYRPDLGAGADRNIQLITRYDAAGNVIGQRDALGRWTTTEYDVLNRPITVTVNYENGDPLTVDLANQGWTDGSDTDIVTVTRYRPDGGVEQEIDNYVDGEFTATEPITDRITLYQYDGLGRVITGTLNYDPPTLGSRTDTNRSNVTAYDPLKMRMLGQRDALGRWVSQQYDLLGRMTTSIQNCTGGSAPASCGSITADANVPTTMHYDALGRAFETVDALGHVTHTRYDDLGHATAMIQNYVAPGTPTTAITNVTTLAAYDGLGRTTVMTDALGYTTYNAYNGLSQTTIVTDSMGRITLMGYDGTGALRWSRRAGGQFTVVQVDGLGRTTATIVNYEDGVAGGSEPADQDVITRTVYDVSGRRIRTIDPADHATAFAYDQQDRLISVTEHAVSGSCTAAPCNVVTQYRYDRAGNRTAIVDTRGNVRMFSYDAAHQSVEARDALDQATSWEYDLGGRMTAQHDPRGSDYNLTFQYDDLDRPTQTSASALDGPISQTYDALGRRTSLTDASGLTSFGYDALDRMTSVDVPFFGTTSYSYDAHGRRTQIIYPNTITLDYSYTPDGQLDDVSEDSILWEDYSYDSSGRLSQVERRNGTTTTYAYDEIDRVIDLHTTLGTDEVSRFSYGLDRLGRRTAVTETLASSGMVADIRTTGSGNSNPTAGVTINGIYYFVADDGVHGAELWKSDGTTAGTVLVKDIQSGSTGSNPQYLTVADGTLFFAATESTSGQELWKSDGTAAGTVLVKDIRPGFLGFLQGITAVNNTLFFAIDDGTNGTELWKSDGTSGGTVLVKDIRSGSSGSNPQLLTAVNGTLFFAANDGSNGNELWKSDGTSSGTVLVKDILSGSTGSGLLNLKAVNSTLFFAADDGSNGNELWKSDGTSGGTVLVKDILSGSSSSNVTNLAVVNGTLFFAANDGTNGQELWKSDGTSGGTVLVKDIQSGSGSASPQRLTAVGSTLFFVASDTTSGAELWKSDGTSGGTVLVKDIRAGSTHTNPLNLTAVGGQLMFVADDGTHGQELWSSDGTSAGTLLLQDIVSGSGGANPNSLTVSGAAVFFAATDGTHGSELWRRLVGRTIQYGYDGLGRLTGANESPGNSYAYAYDDAGNRTGVWLNSTQIISQSYNVANQVDGWSYDAIGNLIGDGSATYGYDALNRVITTTIGLENRDNLYNGDGLLVAQTEDITTTNYLHDLAAPLAQVLDIEQSGNHVQHLYGRERFVEVHGSSGLDETWYLGDALSSVRLTLAYNGAYLASANYDPWGQPEGSLIAPFGFTGELQDSGGMVYLRARWYNAGNGTFTSRDSFPGFPEQPYSLHPYQYGYSDPVLLTDPTGQWVDDPGPSSMSRACAQTQGTLLDDESGCEMPFEADLDLMNTMKAWHGAKPHLDKPCIPYVEFEIVFLDGTRLCVLNLTGMQFGVLLDPGLLERIENAPTCLQPVFEVQSNRRIIMHNDDDDDDDKQRPGNGGPPPSGPNLPDGHTTPKGRKLTAHAERDSLLRHGFREPFSEVDDIIDGYTRKYVQLRNNATAYVKSLPGRGRSYNVAIVNEETNSVVTALRRISRHELDNLARNYQWYGYP